MLFLNISQRIPDQKLKSEIKYFLTELKNFLSTGSVFIKLTPCILLTVRMSGANEMNEKSEAICIELNLLASFCVWGILVKC